MEDPTQSLKERVKASIAVNQEKRCCKNCVKGKSTGFSKEMLCWEKGIVSENYCCSSHHFFIIDDFKKRDFYRCSDCEFFIFHPNEHIRTYGVCEMFSVRKCDGSIKRACSKFMRRKEHIA